MALIPIEEHFLYRVVMDAYDHAYQVGSAVIDGVHWEERAHEVEGILAGFPQTDFNGEPTPLDRQNPQKLRQVLDTFMARYCLDTGLDLTVTDLPANMGEPAVRSSLSSEGIKTVAGKKGEKNQVPNSDAVAWLSGRRGFVPTMRFGDGADDIADVIYSLFSADSLPFEAALRDELVQQADIPAMFLEQLLSTDEVPAVDAAALERLSIALTAPVPIFVGKAVTAILMRRERLA